MNGAREVSTRHPVLVVMGTRPEAIKLAPVLLELRRRGVPSRLISTGQHREMLGQVLSSFDLEPERDLGVMTHDQTLAELSSRLLSTADRLLAESEPSWVVVQGDTTTVAMFGLAAFYRRVRVAHVEAGLRTFEKYDPFPEEINRTLLGHLADLHLAPTPEAAANLRRQGVPEDRVRVTGNTVVDALREMQTRLRDWEWPRDELGFEPDERPLVVVTGHRRENFGPPFRRVCEALAVLADRRPEIRLVYPVHLNPRVQGPAGEILGGRENLLLLPPLPYRSFLQLMLAARFLITDSGGIQEEATALGLPTLVTRETSERPEAIACGVAELVGTDPARILAAAGRLLDDADHYRGRARPHDAFGDGRAASRCVEALLEAGA